MLGVAGFVLGSDTIRPTVPKVLGERSIGAASGLDFSGYPTPPCLDPDVHGYSISAAEYSIALDNR